jgi:hypothetical protein
MTEKLVNLDFMASVFNKPTATLFLRITLGWILCPSRRTLTGIYRVGDPEQTTNYDAVPYFFRDADWESAEFWKQWATYIVSVFAAGCKILTILVDDTVLSKTGRKIDGARTCRDAVRSTQNTLVKCWGLQYVPICLLIHPPWGGEPIAIPINIRLNRKAEEGKKPVTLLDHTEAMIKELAEWFPDKSFRLVGDGAYAPLAGENLPHTEVISRLRSDAAIHELPTPRLPGQRGRPRVKGDRLPTPKEIADQATDWRRVKTFEHGIKMHTIGAFSSGYLESCVNEADSTGYLT